MSIILWIVGATFLVSLISFVGVITLSLKRKFLEKILSGLVAFAAGTLIGVAFFDLVPEALGAGSSASLYLVSGVLLFFIVERFVGWHHAHHDHDINPSEHHKDKDHDKYHHKPFIYTNLMADGVHNFLDGTVIAAAFITNIPLGIVTSIAVALHEIPQEIGDFAILVHGGLSIRKALIFNFISAITALAGGLIAFYLSSSSIGNLNPLLLGIGGGGLLYLALTDLLPEINKENDIKRSLIQFVFLFSGILIVYSLALLLPKV